MDDERTYFDHAVEQVTRERGTRPTGAAEVAMLYCLTTIAVIFLVQFLRWPAWVVTVMLPTLGFLFQRRRVRVWENAVKQRERQLKFDVRGFHAD